MWSFSGGPWPKVPQVRSKPSAMRFHLLTAVWGADFIDRFARITLRSLLAPGNLPELSAAHHVVYHIHTTPADAERLRADSVFKEATRYAQFRVHFFSLAEIDRTDPSSHWVFWHRGAAQLQEVDDVLVTVAADHLFSRDTMSQWAALFRSGRLAVFGSGVQVVMETLQEEIETSFPLSGPIDLGLNDLHALMFRHLHPIKITMLRGSPRWTSHPEEHLRPLNGYGFAQNVLASHAVAFRPRAIRMNENFCPVEKLDRIAFEPCRYLSLEPVLKLLPLYLHRWRADDAALSQFGEWADTFLFDANVRESRTAHVYAVSRPAPLIERRRAELASQSFVRQIHATRRIFQLWRCLRESGRDHAARWLATAHMQFRLRRRLALRLPVTIFVPEDGALERMEAREQLRLLASGGGDLLAVLRAHVAEGRHAIARGDRLVSSDQGSIRALDGSCYSVSGRGAVRVTGGPIRLSEIDVFSIDRPLAPLALRPATTAEAGGLLVRAIRHRADLGMRHARRALLQMLRHNRRLYMWVVNLRRAWRDLSRRRSQGVEQIDDPSVLAAHGRALAARSLDALRQLYDFYRAAVLEGTGIPVSPEKRVHRMIAPGDDACALLSDAIRTTPHFAEAWLELGFARLDAGQPDAALQAFARASVLSPTLPVGRFDPDPRIVAAIGQARLLMSRNRRSEALAALEAAPLIRPIPRDFHEARGRLLLGAGRINEALDAFDRCMRSDYIHQSFAGLLPRSLTALEAALGSATSAAGRRDGCRQKGCDSV
jgi:tetratricopeptide (TPR) repeat protein